MRNRKILAAYVPVIHRGYLQFFDKFSDAEEMYVFDKDILNSLDYMRKDLRALAPEQQVEWLSGAARFKRVELLSYAGIKILDHPDNTIIMPDEDISREISSKFELAQVEYYPVFLRWDRSSVEGVDNSDDVSVISADAFDQKVMQRAMTRAKQSSDIWRRVGAILIASDGTEVGGESNQGEPTDHSPWMEGDPRNVFHRGVGIEMSLFTHAEAGLIAEAARRGVSLDGASVYVTTYPCPACAKLIAHSGIKTCYYKDGYAVLDGGRILDEYGVETIRVDMPGDGGSQYDESLVPYIKKK